MADLRGRAYGIGLVTAASVLWSTAGLFVRLVDAEGPLDVWTMLTWRSLFAAASLFLVIGCQRRSLEAIRAIGWPGLAAVPVSAISMFSYVAALKLTTVANVLTVYATVPFAAAGLAYLWMGERVQRRVLAASAVALVGIVIMAGSATRPRDIAGNALALLMTLSFAVMLVMARRHPGLGMAPVNAFGAALCAAFCWPLMAPGLPSLYQLVILGLFGATNTAFAYLLFLVGGRHIPSGEAGLIAMLDVVLGPFWVWLVFAEQPGGAALLGGGLVLAAVLWYLVSQLHEPALSPPAHERAAGMKKTAPVVSARLFFYGTLLDRELRRLVIGRDVDVVPATLPGWRRLAVAGHAYPMIRRDADASVAGVVTEPLSAGELARLRHYEGEDYPLAAVELRDDSGAGIAAALFAPPADRFAAAGEWQLADWQRRDRADILDRLRDHDWPQG